MTGTRSTRNIVELRLVITLICVSLSCFGNDALTYAQSEAARLKKLPETVNRWVDEAKFLFYQGKYTTGDEKKERLFTEGIELADKARGQEPKNPGALFWWVACKGELAKLQGKLTALNALKKLEATLLDLKTWDPAYRYSGADRVLARIYHQAPAFISIGSSKKARLHFQEAMKNAPHYPANQLYYAEFLLDQGEAAEARKLAKAALESKEMSKNPLEEPEWKIMAGQILEKTKGVTP